MSTKPNAVNYWWIVANENEQDLEHSWHWQQFFENPRDPQQNTDWGGPEWINSTVSFARIKEMRKGGVVVAYQAGEGIVGLAYLASNGYQHVKGGSYDTFNLKPTPTIWLTVPIPFSIIRQLPEARENIEFIRSKRGTVTRISKKGFDEIVKAILTFNASQSSKVTKFLQKCA